MTRNEHDLASCETSIAALADESRITGSELDMALSAYSSVICCGALSDKAALADACRQAMSDIALIAKSSTAQIVKFGELARAWCTLQDGDGTRYSLARDLYTLHSQLDARQRYLSRQVGNIATKARESGDSDLKDLWSTMNQTVTQGNYALRDVGIDKADDQETPLVDSIRIAAMPGGRHWASIDLVESAASSEGPYAHRNVANHTGTQLAYDQGTGKYLFNPLPGLEPEEDEASNMSGESDNDRYPGVDSLTLDESSTDADAGIRVQALYSDLRTFEVTIQADIAQIDSIVNQVWESMDASKHKEALCTASEDAARLLGRLASLQIRMADSSPDHSCISQSTDTTPAKVQMLSLLSLKRSKWAVRKLIESLSDGIRLPASDKAEAKWREDFGEPPLGPKSISRAVLAQPLKDVETASQFFRHSSDILSTRINTVFGDLVFDRREVPYQAKIQKADEEDCPERVGLYEDLMSSGQKQYSLVPSQSDGDGGHSHVLRREALAVQCQGPKRIGQRWVVPREERV